MRHVGSGDRATGRPGRAGPRPLHLLGGRNDTYNIYVNNNNTNINDNNNHNHTFPWRAKRYIKHN